MAKKIFFILINAIIGVLFAVNYCLSDYEVIRKEELNHSQKSRAVLPNHTSHGPSVINSAYIENVAQIFGPFTAEDDFFNKLIVYGPLDISNSQIKVAQVYGPAKITNSKFINNLTVFGPLIAKHSTFNNINVNAKKIFLEDSKVESIKVEEDDDPSIPQVLYLHKNVEISSIEFKSGKGIIIISSKDIDFSKTKVMGATVQEIYS